MSQSVVGTGDGIDLKDPASASNTTSAFMEVPWSKTPRLGTRRGFAEEPTVMTPAIRNVPSVPVDDAALDGPLPRVWVGPCWRRRGDEDRAFLRFQVPAREVLHLFIYKFIGIYIVLYKYIIVLVANKYMNINYFYRVLYFNIYEIT
jgi:hypothetical protein